MRLLFVRHGQSEANAEGRLQGQFDSPLSDLGQAQAQALGQRLQREAWNISTIYTSDLRRAAETAKILTAATEAPLVLDARLREYHVGELTNIVWRDIEILYPDIWHAFHHSSEWVPIPGEEGHDTFRQRLAAVQAEIRAAHGEGEVVALVSHGGSLGMLMAHILRLDTRRFFPFRFSNASLSILDYRPRGPILSLLNDTCHLDGSIL
jgi:broad specificity phosphatase PhoE